MTEQMRLRHLLKHDENYRTWFRQEPTITIHHTLPPWRLYVQMEERGRWAKVDLRDYLKAYRGVKSRLPEAWDMTIHSRGQRFNPPVIRLGKKKYWMPMPDGHRWCPLCRRPTVFRRFNRHPALRMPAIDPAQLRCSICGVPSENLKPFLSPLSWPATSDVT